MRFRRELIIAPLFAYSLSGQILSHDLKVSVRPASGIAAEDAMRIRTAGNSGMAIVLNRRAAIESVTLQGREVPHQFHEGRLRADVPAGDAQVTVRYSLQVEHDPEDTNDANFLENAGHLRNQYFWHPSLGLDPAGPRPEFHVQVRIPKEYRVTTSLPQSERIDGAERVVEGRSVDGADLLTLVYDRDWQVERREFGGGRVEFFAVPGAQPTIDETFADFQRLYDLFAARFGPRPAGYTALVQARSIRNSPQWRFTSNQAIVCSGANPASRATAYSASFAHEIAHLWNLGAAGEGRNFLSEGWSTWAEASVIEKELGADTGKQFWGTQQRLYFFVYDGKASLLSDHNNSGVSYPKGAWIYRMLEGALGMPALDRALAEFSLRTRQTRAGWELLAECLQRQSPPDFNAIAFLKPWLAEKLAPHLGTQIQGRTVTIRQDPAVFELPIVIEATTPAGPERRRVWLRGPETTIRFDAEVVSVKLDPDGLLLIH